MAGQQSITQDQAIGIAKELASKTYSNIESFEIRVDGDASQWMVNFTNPKANVRGDGHHFSVSVNKSTGEARLFRGR